MDRSDGPSEADPAIVVPSRSSPRPAVIHRLLSRPVIQAPARLQASEGAAWSPAGLVISAAGVAAASMLAAGASRHGVIAALDATTAAVADGS